MITIDDAPDGFVVRVEDTEYAAPNLAAALACVEHYYRGHLIGSLPSRCPICWAVVVKREWPVM
jgi:hypothetical protein